MTAAEEYSAYLRSAHWRRLRKRYKKERPWNCAICGGQGSLELHHKTYERRGAELLDDLVPLCANCHPLLHQLAHEEQSGLDPAAIFDRRLGKQRREQRNAETRERIEREAESIAARKREIRERRERYNQRRQLLNRIADRVMEERGLTGYIAKQGIREEVLRRAQSQQASPSS